VASNHWLETDGGCGVTALAFATAAPPCPAAQPHRYEDQGIRKMRETKSRRGVLDRFEQSSSEVREYFEHLPGLMQNFPWDISLSYMFSRVELAHNMALYCGVVKVHRANAHIARSAIESYHMTREDFKHKFGAVFGTPIPGLISGKLTEAENIRDRVMHGKTASDDAKRKAVVAILEYAEQFNALVQSLAGFRPFGSLRGFKGRAQPLDESTTRWMLKGMGFAVG